MDWPNLIPEEAEAQFMLWDLLPGTPLYWDMPVGGAQGLPLMSDRTWAVVQWGWEDRLAPVLDLSPPLDTFALRGHRTASTAAAPDADNHSPTSDARELRFWEALLGPNPSAHARRARRQHGLLIVFALFVTTFRNALGENLPPSEAWLRARPWLARAFQLAHR